MKNIRQKNCLPKLVESTSTCCSEFTFNISDSAAAAGSRLSCRVSDQTETQQSDHNLGALIQQGRPIKLYLASSWIINTDLRLLLESWGEREEEEGREVEGRQQGGEGGRSGEGLGGEGGGKCRK
jgi:hypothetical protein